MAEPSTSEAQILATILTEFRNVGAAISLIAERTARTETRLDEISKQITALSDLQKRVDGLEHELASRKNSDQRVDQKKTLIITGAIALISGSMGIILSHYLHWK